MFVRRRSPEALKSAAQFYAERCGWPVVPGPYGVLLAAGTTFDVLDAPAQAGWRALGELKLVGIRPGPVLRLPDGRLAFWVAPGGREVFAYTMAHNDAGLDLRHHGAGHYLTAPVPGRTPRPGEARWAVAPDATDTQLPDVVELLGTLLRACRRHPRPADRRPAGRR